MIVHASTFLIPVFPDTVSGSSDIHKIACAKAAFLAVHIQHLSQTDPQNPAIRSLLQQFLDHLSDDKTILADTSVLSAARQGNDAEINGLIHYFARLSQTADTSRILRDSGITLPSRPSMPITLPPDVICLLVSTRTYD